MNSRILLYKLFSILLLPALFLIFVGFPALLGNVKKANADLLIGNSKQKRELNSNNLFFTPGEIDKARINESFEKLPLSFEANSGQIDSRVRFISSTKEYKLYLTATEALFIFRSGDNNSN